MKRQLSKLEDAWVLQKNRFLIRHFGYTPVIQPYISFGTTTQILVQLRVILVSVHQRQNILARGWRSFFTKQAPGAKLKISFANTDKTITATTDRGGYINQVFDMELSPFWQDIYFEFESDYKIPHKKSAKVVRVACKPEAKKVKSQAMIIDDEDSTGIICDIDDTIMISNAPSKLVAVKNLLFTSPTKRKTVPGMSQMLTNLIERTPNSFIVYLSAGPWNQFGFLKRFIVSNHFPFGGVVLQDIGPDETKFFESTKAHKTAKIYELFKLFHKTKWILIGDDGQHDVDVYKKATQNYPGRVKTILVRQLSKIEQVVTTGIPFATNITGGIANALAGSNTKKNTVPIFYASNGYELEEVYQGYTLQSLDGQNVSNSDVLEQSKAEQSDN